MWFQTLALAAAQLAAAQELMRFGCSQLTIDQIDPLEQPGIIPSAHMHQFVGGNSLNATMTPVTYDPSVVSNCTSCTYSQDFSNYWTPSLYYKARNGTYKRVPQVNNLGLGTVAGITVYYIRGYTENQTVTAFPKGFRMMVGDPTNRAASTMQKQLCFRCESNMQQNPFGGAPCTGSDTQNFPTQVCGGGWRVTLTFPSCWDGVNTDSPDHKSHISYPASGTFETDGACPSTHPVKIPQVMYEVIFDTRDFNNQADWPTDGTTPWYWSMGDNTGYGLHGDYLFGWEGNMLQTAMDTHCASDNCTALTRQTDQQAIACTKAQVSGLDIGDDKWLTTLPGIPQ
ncbi:hypothetical protein F5Y16DRAFT_409483 [Xylariaceae sp. FL0255]|nr:hypothetical protein F5Y16DRAFT_409483 [Xylariaceae sp. FL0255]